MIADTEAVAELVGESIAAVRGVLSPPVMRPWPSVVEESAEPPWWNALTKM